jgi:hypothetical protein
MAAGAGVCEEVSELSERFAMPCALDEAGAASAHPTSHALCASGARAPRACRNVLASHARRCCDLYTDVSPQRGHVVYAE